MIQMASFRQIAVTGTIVLGLAACDGGSGGTSADPVRLVPFACGNLTTPIHEIQGITGVSPKVGDVVDVEGVVTGNFQEGLGGFFIESPVAARDTDVSTSEGLFVLVAERREEVRAGRLLRIRASVTEFGDTEGDRGLTALTAISELVVCGDAELPEPSTIDAPVADWEAYEGMRVTLPGPLTVTGNADLLRFGRVDVSLAGRLYSPTEVARPGAPAREVAQANAKARIALDDNLEIEHPRRVWWLEPRPSEAAPWRVGTELDGVTGIVDQNMGRYRVQLTARPAAVRQAVRPVGPPDVGGDLRIASFNVRNFFNGNGQGGDFPTPRGADSVRSFRQQRDKVVATLAALNADVVALQEVENDGWGEDSAIVELVDSLNRKLGREGDYRFVRSATEQLGKDQIKVGLIYRESRVRVLGEPASLERGVFIELSRVPLAATFEAVDGGAAFTVVSNHFKSKGGCEEASGGDRDQRDFQGCWNDARRRSARELMDWLATDPTGSGSDQVLVMGDLNAHGFEDPVRLMVDRGWLDLIAQHAGDGAYSYVWRGESGRLDHALASASFASRVSGVGEWHVNADELDLFGWSSDRVPERVRRQADPGAIRSSDHDPLLVGLRRE
jgi:predicted extracellular nuclease